MLSGSDLVADTGSNSSSSSSSSSGGGGAGAGVGHDQSPLLSSWPMPLQQLAKDAFSGTTTTAVALAVSPAASPADRATRALLRNFSSARLTAIQPRPQMTHILRKAVQQRRCRRGSGRAGSQRLLGGGAGPVPPVPPVPPSGSAGGGAGGGGGRVRAESGSDGQQHPAGLPPRTPHSVVKGSGTDAHGRRRRSSSASSNASSSGGGGGGGDLLPSVLVQDSPTVSRRSIVRRRGKSVSSTGAGTGAGIGTAAPSAFAAFDPGSAVPGAVPQTGGPDAATAAPGRGKTKKRVKRGGGFKRTSTGAGTSAGAAPLAG